MIIIHFRSIGTFPSAAVCIAALTAVPVDDDGGWGGGGCLAMPQFPPYDLLVRQNNFVQEVCR